MCCGRARTRNAERPSALQDYCFVVVTLHIIMAIFDVMGCVERPLVFGPKYGLPLLLVIGTKGTAHFGGGGG